MSPTYKYVVKKLSTTIGLYLSTDALDRSCMHNEIPKKDARRLSFFPGTRWPSYSRSLSDHVVLVFAKAK